MRVRTRLEVKGSASHKAAKVLMSKDFESKVVSTHGRQELEALRIMVVRYLLHALQAWPSSFPYLFPRRHFIACVELIKKQFKSDDTESSVLVQEMKLDMLSKFSFLTYPVRCSPTTASLLSLWLNSEHWYCSSHSCQSPRVPCCESSATGSLKSFPCLLQPHHRPSLINFLIWTTLTRLWWLISMLRAISRSTTFTFFEITITFL